MKADALMALYERVSDAPDAIARLRRFVLDLAVRGKLVERDEADEPSQSLVKRIAEERARLAGSGAVSPVGTRRSTTADRFPFELPAHWQPARLGDVLIEIQTGPFGSSLHQSDYVPGGTPVINPASIQDGRILPIEKMAVGESTLERLATFKLRAGDIVMARRGEMGRCALVTTIEAGWLCGTGSLVLRPSSALHAPFVALLIGAPYSRDYLGGSAVGTTMQNLNQAILLSLPFPLPPEREQHRIVAKVDELMALLDRLEAARSARDATRDRLTTATLTRLTAPDTDAQTLPTHARFALDALPALTARADQIKQLRQTILNLAVRGQLVPQLPSEEPASVLLAQVQCAKAHLRSQTQDARIRVADDPDSSALPFHLPSGWESQSFENLFLFIDYRGQTPPKTAEGIPLITAKNVRMGRLSREPAEFVSKETYERWMTRGLPRQGDLFFTTEAPLANVCVNEITEPFALAQRVVCLQPFGQIDTRFFAIAIMSAPIQRLIEEHSTGLTAKGIKMAKLKPLPLPVPPLAEQDRIVAKVDEMMALCDRLEAALQAADRIRARLLEALLHEALTSDTPERKAA